MVSQALAARGCQTVRLDTDLYPQEVRLSSHLGAGGSSRRLRVGQQSLGLEEVRSVWYRRFAAGSRLPHELGDTRDACVEESQQTLYGAIAALDCFQLDPLRCVRRADHKEVQLEEAGRLGLCIPRTLITNDPEEALAFYRSCGGPVITKTQTSFAIYRDAEERVVFTSEVREEHLKELDGLAYSPMMFQERLAKQVELRATVVGDRVFTAAVDSGTLVDWRRRGLELIDCWTPYQLPDEVQRGLLALARFFGLNYGAADFIVTPDGRHVFLELNAGGEWFWLQRLWPIAEALADLLAASSGLSFREGNPR